MFDSISAPIEQTGGAPPEGARAPAWRPLRRRGAGSAELKRLLDVLAAIVLLLAFSPGYLLVALAILIDSPGPVLFRQRRTGRNGQVFTIYKFRTMTVVEDGDQIAHATRNDARVTRVGAFLRTTSLDELPQLLNIVRGDMSIVGPRPHALAHDAYYGALLAHYAERFAVRPGVTGLAQVRGHRGEIHDLSCMAKRLDADIDYAANWSFCDDLIIIARTIPVLLSRLNAY